MRLQRTYLVCVIALIIPLYGHSQTHCELKKNKDNIKVFTCENSRSPFNIIKAEFEVNATLNQYKAIVLDVDRYNEWHYNEINQRVIKKISSTEFIYYSEILAPFPVNNRDLILHLKLEQDTITNILTVSVNSIAHYLPQVKKCVRVPKSNSKLTITPIAKSKLKIEYFIEIDPGGLIPAWIANSFSTLAPYETFKKLIEQLEGR